MCVYSMIADHYIDKYPTLPLQPQTSFSFQITEVSRIEFEKLRNDVLEMKELLRKAKIYDTKTGQQDCEMEEKVEKLRKLAELVGINLDEVIRHGVGDANRG